MKKTNLLLVTGSFMLLGVFATAQSRLTITNTTASSTSTPTITVSSVGSGSSALTEAINATGSGGYDNYGIQSRATGGTNYNVGVYGESYQAGITGVGVFGQSVLAVSSNYGVYGAASGGGNFDYAGYFNGDVFTTGSYLPSDGKLKTSIRSEETMLSKIMQLNPVSYEYKPGLSYIHLPKGRQHGFVAQELQKVFPEAVKEIKHPVFEGNKLLRSEDIVAVNYQALVPVLIKAVQEQQAMIEELKKQVSELSSKRITRRSDNTVYLAQAVPNPANSSTVIKYSIPARVQKASLEVYDMAGNKVLQFNNLQGSSQVVVNGLQLQSGTYVYTLLVDGKETISNKFIVAKG